MKSKACGSKTTRRAHAAGALLALCLIATTQTLADQRTVTGNNGTITATASLRFNIAIAKYVMLRVGNADASVASLTFTVAPNPAILNGNSRPYSGAIAPNLATAVATTNPTGTSTLAVAAFTNVAGTALTCSIGALGGATAFAAGATASGVPGTAAITVASGAAGTLQHPGTSLAACDNTTSSPIPSLSTIAGSFTYAATFTPTSLAAGTYGNLVTYTATAP